MSLNQGNDDGESEGRKRSIHRAEWSQVRTRPATTPRYFGLGTWIVGGIIHQNTGGWESSQKERK